MGPTVSVYQGRNRVSDIDLIELVNKSGSGARLTIHGALFGEVVLCDVVVPQPGGVLGYPVRF